MRFTVRLSRPAQAYLRRLDRATQERFLKRFGELSEDPFAHSKPLTGRDARSSRVGGWRIILHIDQREMLVSVVAIAPRGEVYR